ncbi:MAG: hypothetical protein K9M56_00600 [Victivallales bacterium]|nr:hypothetical protein [Victivallales bacterium]
MKKTSLTIMTVAVILFGATLSSLAGAAEKSNKSQTTCPVMGGKINKNLYADVKDPETGKTVRIYVCCQGCLAKIKNNPEKYIKKLEKDGVKPETVGAADKKRAAQLCSQTEQDTAASKADCTKSDAKKNCCKGRQSANCNMCRKK